MQTAYAAADKNVDGTNCESGTRRLLARMGESAKLPTPTYQNPPAGWRHGDGTTGVSLRARRQVQGIRPEGFGCCRCGKFRNPHNAASTEQRCNAYAECGRPGAHLLAVKLFRPIKNTQIHIDLAVARRKAGLSQSDLAHLIAVHPSRVSQFECGKAQPSLQEVAALSVIYGKPIDSLLSGMLNDVVGNLTYRFGTMPKAKVPWRRYHNRAHTLSQLAKRLETFSQELDGAG